MSKKLHGNRIDLAGQRFGKWTVLKPSQANDRASWICRCDCGNIGDVITNNLTRGFSKSCHSCKHQAFRKYNFEYKIWSGMKSRCNNPKHRFYKDYGGRGINVCDQWNTFEYFLADMGSKPQGMTIDRIDNNKGYCPENCRWATRIEQKNNCRNNRWLTKDGITKTMAQWARDLGINYRTLKSRLNIHKWSVEKALTK